MSGLRKRLPQVLRRALQLGVAGFIVYTAFGGVWRNYKHAHNLPRIVGLIEGETWGTLYAWNEDALSLLGEPMEASLGFLGFPWAGRVLGVDTLDPIAVLAHAVATRTLRVELLLALVVPLALVLLFGKVFCSHLCPMRLLFEVGQAARRGIERLGVELPDWGAPQRLGGFVLAGGLAATLLSGTAIWTFVLPYVGLSAAVHLTVATGTVSGLFAIAGGWLLVDMLVAPGSFCHDVCPTGWLLEQLGRFSLVGLVKRGEEPCPSGCSLCTRACPYALSPKDRTHRPACDNCGQCVVACPSDRLVRRLRVLPAVVLALFALPTTASAHHNKGLPHYGYYENYPQVPTEEYIAIQDRWEIGAVFFNFQGLDRRQADTPNDVKIFLYLYDLEEDRNYRGALDVEIRRDGQVVSRFERLATDEEAIYSTRETLPSSGDYELVANVDGREVVLPFHVELLSDQVDWGLILGLGAPVLLLFGFALAGRNRKRRRRRTGARTPPTTGAAVALVAALALPSGAGAQREVEPVSEAELARLMAEVDRCSCGTREVLESEECRGILERGAALGIFPGTNRVMEHYETAEGTVMVMEGMPLWMFLLGVSGVILGSFVATERFAPRVGPGFRKNLLRSRRVYRLVRSRWFQVVPQLTMAGVLLFLVYVGLAGSRVANLAPVAVWTVWWAGLVFAVLLFASAWCFACPWDGLASLMSRLRVAARVETLSLGIRFPTWLANSYPALGLFVLLTWLELGYGVTNDPRATAYLGLAMLAMAIGAALLWDGKKFCAHFCPVGRICGMYSTMSPVEIRAFKPKACRTCTTEDCLNGNDRGYPCPTGISLKVIQSSTNCTMCTECVKSCPRQNVALNLRPFGADLREVKTPRMDEAWLAVVLLSLTLFHGLSMTPAWESFTPGATSILKWTTVTLGTPKVVSFTLAMAVAVAVPIALFWVCCRLGAAWAQRRQAGVTARELFLHHAYSLLPVALFYHLAHNLMHILIEGGEVVPLASDPLGTGADYFGTASAHVGQLVSDQSLWLGQVALILVGHVFGVLVAHRLGRRLFSDRSAAWRSLVPMTAMMVLLSVAGLTLMHLDMNMRVGRL